MPWISRPAAPARRLPVGSRADPRVAPEPPPRGGLRGLRRARRRARRRPSPRSSATSSSRSILHAQLAAEEGVFDLTDVNAAIAAKIVRRHPHVFGDAEARTASDVNRQWERIKADERSGARRRRGGDGRRDAARRAPSTASAGSCRRSPRARRCRSGRRTSATSGRTIEGVLDKVARGAGRAARGRDAGRAGRGVRRPAVRPRQRRPLAGDRGRGRAPRRPTTSSGAGSRASSARPRERGVALRDLDFDGARRAVGRRQGRGERPSPQRRRAPDDDRQPARTVRADGRVADPAPARVSFELGVQKWAEGSCLVRVRRHRRSCARRRSPIASRRTSAARAPAGSRPSTRCCRGRPPSGPIASRSRASSAAGPTRSSG